MADIRIENGNLIVTMKGLRRLLTLKKQLSFPLSHVLGVTFDPTIMADFPRGLVWKKGTNIFNTYYGGEFTKDGETNFWDVRKSENTVVITLKDEKYQRLMIEVDNPRDTVHMIEKALNSQQ